MNASQALYTKQYRLAQHYLGRLRSASHAYQRGAENTLYGLKLAQQDWPQIQHWQAWASSHAAHEQAAEVLCSAYPYEAGELLNLLLTPRERRAWCEIGLAAARRAGDQQAELAHLLALGQVHFQLTEHGYAVSLIQEALELAQQVADQRSIAQALTLLGQIALMEGKFAEAQSYHEQSLTIYRDLHDQTGIAKNLLGLGNILSSFLEYSAMRPVVEDALRIFRQLGDSQGTATALRILGYSWLDDDFEVAQKYLDESLTLFKQLNVQADVTEIYASIGMTLTYRGEFDRAQAAFEEGLRLAEQLQLPGRISIFLTNLGFLSDKRGNLDEARAYYEQGVEIARQLGRFWEVGSSLLILNSLAVRQRDYTGALAYAEQTLAYERAHDHPFFMEQSLLQVAFAHLALGNSEPALTPLREIAAMLQTAPTPPLSLGLICMIAFLYLRVGRAERGAELVALIEQQQYPDYWVYYIDLGRGELQAALGADTFTAALERGKSLDFNATVAEIIAELNE